MPLNELKFIHCADIHIDTPFRDHGLEGYSDSRRQDIRKTFEFIIDLAAAEKVDLLLISGDLYEHNYTSRASIEWIRNLLGSLSKPVAITPGNHDPHAANSWFRILEWPENVHILSDEHPCVKLDSLGAFIYGIGFSSFRQDKPDLSKVSRPMPDCHNILMFHGTLDTGIGKPYNPVTSAELRALGYDYYALGHFHNAALELGLKNAAYPGSPEPLGFDEPGHHGVVLATLGIDDTGEKSAGVRFRNTAQKRYVELDADISSCEATEDVVHRIGSALKEYDGERDLIRLILKGRPGCPIDAGDLERLFPGRRYLKVADQTGQRFDYEALAGEETLKGAFVRDMLGRIEGCNTTDTDMKRILNAALDFGIEALESGRIDAGFE